MGKIKVNDIKVYGYHGCLSEETRIGSAYTVTVVVTADLSKSSTSDELKDTVDYVHINHIVKEEMAIPSKLLEHVGQRMVDRMFKELPMIRKINIEVSKINPPIGGDVAQVTVILSQKRS